MSGAFSNPVQCISNFMIIVNVNSISTFIQFCCTMHCNHVLISRTKMASVIIVRRNVVILAYGHQCLVHSCKMHVFFVVMLDSVLNISSDFLLCFGLVRRGDSEGLDLPVTRLNNVKSLSVLSLFFIVCVCSSPKYVQLFSRGMHMLLPELFNIMILFMLNLQDPMSLLVTLSIMHDIVIEDN